MYHLRICRIGNRIARLHKMPGIDHIFVKQGAFYKSTQLFICPAVIHCTDIGAEKSLNTKFWQITGILDITLLRIVKASRKPFQCTIFSRQLSCIGYRHLIPQRFRQLFDQIVICRHGILGHKKQKIRIRTFCHRPSRSAVVKFAWPDMLYHNFIR